MGNPWKSSIKISDVFLHIKKPMGNKWKSPIKIYVFLLCTYQWEILEIPYKTLWFFSVHKKQWEIHGDPLSKSMFFSCVISKNGTWNSPIKIYDFFFLMRLKNQWEIHGKNISKSILFFTKKNGKSMEIPYQNLSFFSHKKSMGNPWKSHQNLTCFNAHLTKTMGNPCIKISVFFAH
jgi:hypothetical protein